MISSQEESLSLLMKWATEKTPLTIEFMTRSGWVTGLINVKSASVESVELEGHFWGVALKVEGARFEYEEPRDFPGEESCGACLIIAFLSEERCLLFEMRTGPE